MQFNNVVRLLHAEYDAVLITKEMLHGGNVMRVFWILSIGLFPSLAFGQDKPKAQFYEVPIYSDGKIVRVEKVKVAQPQHDLKRRIPLNPTPFKFNGKTYYWMPIKKRE